MLLSAHEGKIQLWDIPTMKLINTLQYEKINEIHSMDISRDGKTIIANYNDIFCSWNI